MADPLAQFRRAPILPDKNRAESAEQPALEDDREYQAFRPVDREQRCLTARAVGPAWVHATYQFLQYVTEDAGRGRAFCAVYGFIVIEVKGRGLGPVVTAIQRGVCEFIQQFDAAKWSRPKDTSLPFIESITFHHGADKRTELLNGKQAEGA